METEEPDIIGQDIKAELFRHHKTAVVLLGFIGHLGDLVSVDMKGYIFLWKYHRYVYVHV